MRLVCPNCSAQYEVDGSMIPDEGRDVQCSNCGHTWFELPPATDFSSEAALQDTLPEEATSEDTAEDGATEASDNEDQDDISNIVEAYVDEDTDIALGDEEDESPSNTVAAAAMAALLDTAEGKQNIDRPRRPADAAALDILREEAEREMSQRRAPASESIELQTELGLDEIQQRNSPSRALRARMAHLGDDDETQDEKKAQTEEIVAPSRNVSSAQRSEMEAYAEPRRDLLPDIDEINSTLKPSSKEEAVPSRAGFLTGFLLMLAATIALIVAYWQAPLIARLFPELEASIIAYVDKANMARDWLMQLLS